MAQTFLSCPYNQRFTRDLGKMRICLLTCPSPFLTDEYVFLPLGLMAVGTALKTQGHDIVIQDTLDHSFFFGIGPTTPQYVHAIGMLRAIRRLGFVSKVLIGGPHAEANPEECLKDGFDVVALGDGENITANTFNATGIVDLGRNPLDTYPIIDRTLLDPHNYRYPLNGQLATTLMTSRGCSYKCGFCANTERQVRYYGIDRIEQEVTHLKKQWGYNALMIFDDVFTLVRKRVYAICEVFKRHGITWRCFVRGDLMVRHGQELANTMADAGCVEVAIGIESGSDRILKIIRKGEDTETIQEAISILHDAGIKVKGLFIVGLPGEDYSSLKETEWFIENTPLAYADFTIYQPYRGTPIWNNPQNYDIAWDDVEPSQRFYKTRPGEYDCRVSTSSLGISDIVEARDKLEGVFKCKQSQCRI